MDWVISVITVRKASILRGKILSERDTMAAAGYFPDNWADEPPARLAEVISLEVDERARREKGLDKTVADSFPASDPPSSIPNPRAEAL
jgi:hypothetical protein